jgi:glycosyltransferase involved in cell wall biosynthesis
VKRAVFAVPGDLNAPTGGYAYDRRIIAELKTLGWQVDLLTLGDGFPDPEESVKRDAQTKLAAAPADCPLIVDGLALGVLPKAAAQLRASHRIVALVHHPLAFESGLAEDRRAALHESERGALAQVKAVIVTSAATRDLLADQYGVAPGAITVVRPGNDRMPQAAGGSATTALLAVGSIVPRKGYDVLVAALAMLKDLDWSLTIAGDRGRDSAAAAQLDRDIAANGLQSRIGLAGAVSDQRLAEMYRSADIFVLASRFEGYGMALADAIAYGLPVVATNAGAIPEAVAADASILVEPDDPRAFATALRRLIEYKSERNMLAQNARRAAAVLPSWRDQAILFAHAIEARA